MKKNYSKPTVEVLETVIPDSFIVVASPTGTDGQSGEVPGFDPEEQG